MAAAMLRASLKARRVITVGFNLRFTTSAQHVAALITSGRIGRPTMPVYGRSPASRNGAVTT